MHPMPISSERLDWRPDVTYVVGHQRPDTDAIASALGYAWVLQQGSEEKIEASRAGQPSEQARYALHRFEQSTPPLLAGASPTFGHIVERVPTALATSPLATALALLTSGESAVPVLGEGKRAIGIAAPLALALKMQRRATILKPRSKPIWSHWFHGASSVRS